VFIHYDDHREILPSKQTTNFMYNDPSTPLADDDPLLTLRYRISLDHLLTSSHCGLFSFHSLHLSHSLLAADIHPDLTTIFSYFIFIFTFIHHVLQRVTVRRATTCTHEYPCAYKGTVRTSAFSSSWVAHTDGYARASARL